MFNPTLLNEMRICSEAQLSRRKYMVYVHSWPPRLYPVASGEGHGETGCLLITVTAVAPMSRLSYEPPVLLKGRLDFTEGQPIAVK
jgi:hypothetical protein